MVTIANLSGSLSSGSTTGATLIGGNITGVTPGAGLWVNPSYTATAVPINNSTTINTTSWTYSQPPPASIKITGTAEFDGEVKFKGVSLDERFNAIEERLAILRPNHDLEGKWEELKELGERYRKLEKEILEKESMWDILKK